MSKVIGIDLGTTNSVVSTIEDGHPVVIPNGRNQPLTQSVVAILEAGNTLVGQLAKRQAATNPEHTIFSIKRQMGTDWTMRVDGREYTPEKVSSLILGKIKKDAEDYLGEEIKKAVITVPAYFNDNQRQATKASGAMAELDVIRIINEPTAAALAYGLHRKKIQKILVWDLGGGTFDVSILELSKGFFRVEAVNGDTQLGGDDWDKRLAEWIANKFQQDEGIDLREDPVAYQRLIEAAEKAKVQLSSNMATDIKFPFIADSKHLDITLTREKLEELTGDLLQRMVAPTKRALADAGLTPEDIDQTVLVGGATRTPAVKRLVKELIGKEPYKKIDPDQVVAIGASIQAGILTDQIEDVVLVDVTPLSLGIETRGGLFAKIIDRNTTIPTSRGQIFTNAHDRQSEMEVHVLQGERESAEHNLSLGKFQLDIPPLERGRARIEVTFEIDADGIIHVTARDLHTDEEKNLTIDSPSRLSEDEIERMVEEAREHAEEDETLRKEVETRIRADNAIHLAKEMLKKARDESYKKELKETLVETKKALSSGDSERIELKTRKLGRLLNR